MHRYVKNAFSPSTTVSTVGASFITKRVYDSLSDTTVRLQIWDTAGQERFRSISRLYYRGADAGLLCYDITSESSFTEMTTWLEELKRNLGEDVPLVIHVVGTKSDIVALDPSKRKVPFEKTIAYVADQLYPSLASTPPPTAHHHNSLPLHPSSTTTTPHATLGPAMSSPDSKRSSGFWTQEQGWDSCHEISAKDGEGIEEVFRVITRKLVERRNRHLNADMTPGWDYPSASLSFAGTDGGGAGNGNGSGGRGGYFDAHGGNHYNNHSVNGGTTPGTPFFDGNGNNNNGSFRLGSADKRRSWLGISAQGFSSSLANGSSHAVSVVGAGEDGENAGKRAGGGKCC